MLPDDHRGEHDLVEVLIAAGHRRIGFLTLPPALVAHGLRLDGYRQALAEAGIPYDPALVINADRDGTPEERALLIAAVEALSALADPPTGLCCGNDHLAAMVYGILRARGIAVPEGMSVAGFDNSA